MTQGCAVVGGSQSRASDLQVKSKLRRGQPECDKCILIKSINLFNAEDINFQQNWYIVCKNLKQNSTFHQLTYFFSLTVDERDRQQQTSVPPSLQLRDWRKCCLCPPTLQINSLVTLNPLCLSRLPLSFFPFNIYSIPLSLFISLSQHFCPPDYFSHVIFSVTLSLFATNSHCPKAVPLPLRSGAMKLQCPLVAYCLHNRAQSEPSCRSRCSFMFLFCFVFSFAKASTLNIWSSWFSFSGNVTTLLECPKIIFLNGQYNVNVFHIGLHCTAGWLLDQPLRTDDLN